MEAVESGMSELESFLMSSVDKEYWADEWIDDRIDGSNIDVGSWFFIVV